MSAHHYCYLVTIEGIGGSTGQTRYCWPAVPSYASALAHYVAGLADPPKSLTGQWDIIGNELSCGRYTLSLQRGKGPIAWHATEPTAIGETREELDDSETEIDLNQTCATLGIAVDDVLYCERETWLVTGAGAGDTHIDVTRGYAGSTATEHPYGSDIFRVPPALTGRTVTVYRTPRTGGAAGDEVAISYGYLAGEIASGIHDVTIEVQDRFVECTIVGPTAKPVYYQWADFLGVYLSTLDPPYGCTTGGYWLLEPAGAVLSFAWDGSAWGQCDTRIAHRIPWARDDLQSVRTDGWMAGTGWDRHAYPILWSSTDGDYPSFRYYDVDATAWVDSDHPVVIALCLLMSLDGSNYDAGDEYRYDLGATGAAGGLYPDFALGVPRAQIDLASFESALWGNLAELRAPWLWIRGGEGASVRDLLWRLFAPVGYVCGCGRDGRWTLLRLHDAYADATLVTVDALDRAAETQTAVVSRAVDTITLGCNADPDGESQSSVVIDEVTGRRYYPPHVGERQDWSPLPYDAADYEGECRLYTLISARIRRMADRYTVLSGYLRSEYYDQVEIGTALEIGDLGACNPRTGERVDTTHPIYVLVTELTADYYTRTLRFSGVVLGSLKPVVSPSALITQWNSGGGLFWADVEQYQYSEGYWYTTGAAGGDGTTFTVGDRVALVDSHLVPLSDTTGAAVSIVTLVTATTIRVAPTFTLGGGAVVPNTGDIIVYADYDDCTTTQTEKYGHVATGGAPGNAVSIGTAADDPYLIGD